MSNAIKAADDRKEHKLTAAQVKKDCPASTSRLGQAYRRAFRQGTQVRGKGRAALHGWSVAQHLAKARKLATTAASMRFGKGFSPTWASRVFMSCLQSRTAKSRSRK